MRIGILFILASVLFLLYAIEHGDGFVLLVWPAAGFALAGYAYLANKPSVFGKNANGTMRTPNVIVLLPYLLYLWGTWHVLRLVKSENAFDRIDGNLFVGRRLLADELPGDVKMVVDLTCEFNETDSPCSFFKEALHSGLEKRPCDPGFCA